MEKKSLQQRIINYLRNHPDEWIAKERICELAKAKGGYVGENTGRRLRILAEASQYGANPQSPCYQEQLKALELLKEAKVEIKNQGKRRHSHYRYLTGKKTIEEVQVVEIDGKPVAKRIMKEIYA